MGVIVRQKKKGRGQPWWVFINHNGRRTSKKVGDKKAAEEVASTIRAKLRLGEFNVDTEKKSVPTFRVYSGRFMDTYSAMNHKPSTHDSYRSALNMHLLPEFGEKELDAITRKDVRTLSIRNVKKGSLAGALGILRHT